MQYYTTYREGYRYNIFLFRRFKNLKVQSNCKPFCDVIKLITMSGLELDGVISLASERLGYPDLRPKQRSAIRSFMEGNDAFIELPTGSGKSLC